MAQLADAIGSKPIARKGMRVRIPLRAPARLIPKAVGDAGGTAAPDPQKAPASGRADRAAADTIGPMTDFAEFLVGVVVGISLTALLWIIVAPSRRVRAERPLAPDVEAQLLLGEDPDRAEPAESKPPVEHPRHYDTQQLQALRKLGNERRGRGRSR